ncbi:MAG: MlaD family protein [Planctomycetota bacterium]
MTERNRNIVVGFVTLAGLVGLAFLLLLFGYVPRFVQSGYFVTIELPDASSLNNGSRVELTGIDIGKVENIDFKQPFGSGVTVRVRIREGVQVPTEAEPQVEKPLLGGSPTIKFAVKDLSNGPPKSFLTTDGSAVVQGRLSPLAGVFGQIERMSNSFDALSTEWQGVGQKVNAMLETQDLAAVEAGEVSGNLTTAVARVDLRLIEFKEILAGVDAFVNDETLRKDVTATASNARKASENLAETMGALESRYVALADDVSLVVEQMNKLLVDARKPRGTVGKLVDDPALYDNLDDAAKRIGQAADELKLLLEKWKAEGVPVKL